MAMKRQQDADQKRETHNSITTDWESEHGDHPIGQLVHLSSVTHAWRGVLKDVTPSYYILDSAHPVALVDSTGPIRDYVRAPVAVRDGDDVPAKSRSTVRVLRGAVAWMISWPREA